jgi:hypothetical protein
MPLFLSTYCLNPMLIKCKSTPLLLLSLVSLITLTSSCASLYYQIIPHSRGKIVEVITNPPHADIYISNDKENEGRRLDSMICSSTPCQVYIEPEQFIILKKKGYRTEQISVDTKRDVAYYLAYYLVTPTVGATVFTIATEVLKINSWLSAGAVLVGAAVSAYIDIKNPKNKIVDGISSPIQLELLDEALAKQGEIERQIRDEKEELQRNANQKKNNYIQSK